MASGGWSISPEERVKYDQHFLSLRPVNGFITGEKAKGVLMRSGLGMPVLAHIWDLADVNRDGKMDKWEFAIAMHLIDCKSKGVQLPVTLPPTLQPPSQADSTVFGAAPFSAPSFAPLPAASVISAANTSLPSYPSYTLPMTNTAATRGSISHGYSSASSLSLSSWDPVSGATGITTAPPVVPVCTDSYATVHSSRSTATSPTFSHGSSIGASVRLPSLKPEIRTAYIQSFNALDKRLTGYISGIQARNEFGKCGLSRQVLAQIWALSDVDQDGRLSLDEYILAKHYIDAVKAGEPLPRLTAAAAAGVASGSAPRTLPIRKRNFSVGSLDGSEASIDSIEEPKFSPAPMSFEDKRRENFEKGQAELERRRQLLFKQEQREREERDRKEREEAEKKEREREEIERRRQQEYEMEMNRKKEEQLKLEEEYRRRMEQKEAARRELERQKQLEWENMRVHELMMQRQSEQESLCHVKQTHKNLSFQLQALQEQSDEVARQIEAKRDNIFQLTQSIDSMKEQRNVKLNDIERLRRLVSEANGQLMKVRQERATLERRASSTDLKEQPVADSAAAYKQCEALCAQKKSAVEKLYQFLTVVDNDINQVTRRNSEGEADLKQLKRRMSSEQADYDALSTRYEQMKAKISTVSTASPTKQVSGIPASITSPKTATSPGQRAKCSTTSPTSSQGSRGSARSATGSLSGPSATGNSGTATVCMEESEQPTETVTSVANDVPETVKYRALYEFIARSDDELSFQPGDTIVVFKNHAGEPGWLAGQIKEKVGWFPEAFAACIEVQDNHFQPPDESGSVSGTQQHQFEQKLEAINEESFEKEDSHAAARKLQTTATAASAKTLSATPAGSRVPAHALYNWKAKTDNHLTFAKGDLINVLEMQEMWWKGETVDGQVGWFPKSYVKLGTDATEVGSKTSTEAAAEMPVFTAASSNGKESSLLHSGPEAREAEVGATPSTTQERLDTDEWYVALYSFVASEPGDLPFHAGDKILVVQKDSDWWTGRIGDVEGIFPANYVERYRGDASSVSPASSAAVVVSSEPPASVAVSEDEPTATSKPVEFGRAIAPFNPSDSNQLALELGDVVKIRTKSPTGWWEGELQKNNGMKRLGWFPGTYVKIISDEESAAGGKVPPAAAEGAGSASPAELVEAMFDYTPQQDDELELKRGDLITVIEKLDPDWWVGKLASSGRQGLFPANYVQTVSDVTVRVRSLSDRTTLTSDARKRSMYFQELVGTEKNYADDLMMVRNVFQRPLVAGGALSEKEASSVFVSWNRLIQLSQRLYCDLVAGGEEQVGAVMLANGDRMKVYMNFCKHQLAALDIVEEKERCSSTFREIHGRCCQDSNARGLPLSYFILFPVTRLTKYPLMLREMLKYTADGHPDYENLTKAVEAVRTLCDDVNRLATETENARMLAWCQTNVRCDAISPRLLFNGTTNHSGARQFVHVGIVYKAKSNRLLVAFLFNDLLMLTVPDQPLLDPLSFKLTRTSTATFTLYKMPLILDDCQLLKSPPADRSFMSDDETFAIQTCASGNTTLTLRAVSSNAKLMWIKRLESAISEAHEKQRVIKKNVTLPQGGLGRLLIELVQMRNLPIPPECKTCPILAELMLGDAKQLITVDTARSDVLCSTQFAVQSVDVRFGLNLYVHLPFAPDLLIGHAQLMFEDMVKMSGLRRDPVLKQLTLSDDDSTDVKFVSHVIIKFVVHMFDI